MSSIFRKPLLTVPRSDLRPTSCRSKSAITVSWCELRMNQRIPPRTPKTQSQKELTPYKGDYMNLAHEKEGGTTGNPSSRPRRVPLRALLQSKAAYFGSLPKTMTLQLFPQTTWKWQEILFRNAWRKMNRIQSVFTVQTKFPGTHSGTKSGRISASRSAVLQLHFSVYRDPRFPALLLES